MMEFGELSVMTVSTILRQRLPVMDLDSGMFMYIVAYGTVLRNQLIITA